MHKLRILLAEDMMHERIVIESNLRKSLPANVEPEFTFVDHAEAATERSRTTDFDLIILDIDFSQSPNSKGMNGLEAAKIIKKRKPYAYAVVVSSSEEEETMTRATEEFSVDWYLRRSQISYDELAWLARQSLLSRLHRDGSILQERYRFLTCNESARKVLRRVDSVLPNQNALIYGETGTGKELIARRIHENAKTFDGKRPFKILDCSALSENLFEGEVFGHKKGSFTGAMSDRVGALQLVNGGDLFLDEIHNIPIHLQQKLLRVLNDGVFSPIGSNEEIHSKFRIIAATNIPISEAIASGRLLPDFVERIRKIRIDLLPLRERPEDISLLVKSYIANIGILDKEFSDDGLEYMKSLPWSGNIRELKGFIDRCVAEVKIPIITSRQIKNLFPSLEKDSELVSTPENDLYDSFSENLLRKGISFSEAQTQLEKTFLKKSIDRFDSIRDLAEANGLNRKTLGKRLIALGISRS